MFTIATGLCALGTNLTNLAMFRALTGIFAASVMPIALALIVDAFPIKERQGAIGTYMGISFLGQGLSMAIGGTIACYLLFTSHSSAGSELDKAVAALENFATAKFL